jgi:hypothetical protein
VDAFAMSDQPAPPSRRSHKLQKESAKQKRAKERAFRPFAEQIGWIAYEWNRLQEALGDLFSDVVKPGVLAVGNAIWHSSDNERALRRMLQEALEAAKPVKQIEQEAYDHIVWILSQINKLAGRRNTAIHAPFALVSGSTSDPKFEVVPMYFFGHPRAEELRDKSVLAEFKWYRDHLERLADFAEELHFAMIFPDVAWPDRPLLLPLGQFESQKVRRRKTTPK